MANKVIIIILVFLVVISGGLGAYSYLLGQQIEALSGQLSVFQQEQSSRFSAVGDELSALRTQTTARIGALRDDMDGAKTQIGTLQEDLSQTLNEVGALGEEVEGLKDLATGLSQSVLSADTLYQKVSQASVRMGDGDRLVGSGFVYDDKGHVVTANHVVERLSTVYVTLADGRSTTATVVGRSEASDVAVVKLNDEDLFITPQEIGDSAQLKIGESVIAIGNPFSLNETLTSGIVSQVNRFVRITSDLEDRWIANLIQYDAAVNPGNSGGALFNARGEVVGLVIARVDPNRGEGIYYAVSSNKFQRVASQLIEHGAYDYPWVGINISNITPREARERALETTNGVVVQGILPGSPAQGSDIKVDDVIVAMDSVPVNNVGDLTSYLGAHKSPDDLASLTIFRHGVEMEVSLKVGQKPS